jgi:phosphotransferase system, enzyme I, PtsP
MNITTELLSIVEQAHSVVRILEAGARVIAERMCVDRCLVFLFDEHGELVRSATYDSTGNGRDQRTDAEVNLAAAQATADRRVTTVRGGTVSLLAMPLLLRDDVLGALLLESAGERAFSVEDLRTLAAAGAQLVGIIEKARIIDALDRGEHPVPRARPRRPTLESEDGERVLHGIGASPGVAIGPAVFRGAPRVDLSAAEFPAGEPAVERARVRAALEKTRNDVVRVQLAAAREIDEEHALIFASHLLLLNDPALVERIDRGIEGGMSAPRAIAAALYEFETRLALVADDYIRERIDDVEDLRSRLLDHVLDTGTRNRFGARIVLTDRIPPSLVVELKTEGAQALVAETGGATSHGILLARAMGIPAVTGIPDLLTSARPGDQLVVDGTSGVVIVRPGAGSIARYEEERRRVARARSEHAKYRNVVTKTADGERIVLHANVGVASELTVARENGAEGIGLYRTEFPFILRDAFPTLGEQVRIYGKAYELFPGGPINFRILDLGGDKFVGGGSIAAARSAFHGYRSLRVLFDHPDVFRDQVQALALAAGTRPLRILLPMVTSIEELLRAKAIIRQALESIVEPGAQIAPEIGAMIEVPAAVELAADIAREVDFLSIGTNDLMQYALVVDREDSRMAKVADPYHPAILRMTARVVAAARAAGKSVSVCGEIAVRPDIALALTALGVDSLSVVPTAIPELKQALAGARLEPMRRAIAGILALSDASSVVAALREAQFASA